MSEIEEDIPAEDAGETMEFDQSFQRKVAHLMLRDSHFVMNTKDLVRPEHFTEGAVGAVARIAQEFAHTYKAAPDTKILPTLLKDEIAKKRIRPDMVEEVKSIIREAIKSTDLGSAGYVLGKVRDFAKHQAIEQAMIASLPLMAKKDWASIEKLFAQAHAVGTVIEDPDYDYFAEIRNRTQKRHDIKSGKVLRRGIPTGYSTMDAYMYHGGWGRRELSIMMGAAKAGKSMSLADFGKNASLLGFNVLYDSYEVSREIVADRLDANYTDTLMRELSKDPDEVERILKAIEAKGVGRFHVRETATGTRKPSQLHRLIQDYKARGIKFDLIVPDYADIMASEYRSDQLIDNLRSIYIDLRAIAFEEDAAMLSATQTNRSGAAAHTAKATDVGDDFNKIRTADLVIGINATDEEKRAGEARLYWAVSRNSEDGFTLRIKQDRAKMKFLTRVVGKE